MENKKKSKKEKQEKEEEKNIERKKKNNIFPFVLSTRNLYVLHIYKVRLLLHSTKILYHASLNVLVVYSASKARKSEKARMVENFDIRATFSTQTRTRSRERVLAHTHIGCTQDHFSSSTSANVPRFCTQLSHTP